MEQIGANGADFTTFSKVLIRIILKKVYEKWKKTLFLLHFAPPHFFPIFYKNTIIFIKLLFITILDFNDFNPFSPTNQTISRDFFPLIILVSHFQRFF